MKEHSKRRMKGMKIYTSMMSRRMIRRRNTNEGKAMNWERMRIKRKVKRTIR